MRHECKVALAVIVFAMTMVHLGSVSIEAQSGTASISGRVQDPEGGVVPGATVTLVQAATGASRTVITNESGAYQFTGLVPATYEMTVTLDGFRTVVLKDLELLVDTQVRQNVELVLGALEETMVVTIKLLLRKKQISNKCISRSPYITFSFY